MLLLLFLWCRAARLGLDRSSVRMMLSRVKKMQRVACGEDVSMSNRRRGLGM